MCMAVEDACSGPVCGHREQQNSHERAESVLRVVNVTVNIWMRECGCMREKYRLRQQVVFCSVASSLMGKQLHS